MFALSQSATEIAGVVILSVLAVSALAVLFTSPSAGPEGAVHRNQVLLVLGLAVAIRLGCSLIDNGGQWDVFNCYGFLGSHLIHGGDAFVVPYIGRQNYPPVLIWWWGVASAVFDPNRQAPLFSALVRFPFWLADSLICVLILTHVRNSWRLRAAIIYALIPAAVAAGTLHGQADPLVVVMILMAEKFRKSRPTLNGVLYGVAVALKVWPLFFLPAYLVGISRQRWLKFVALALAPSVLAFVIYAPIHPNHVVDGLIRILTYSAHTQGLGTSLLVLKFAPSAISLVNILAGLLVLGTAVLCHRWKAHPLDAVALGMLVLLTFSATTADQYLMWPFAFLLIRGRRRIVGLLIAGLTPAVAYLDLGFAGASVQEIPLMLVTLTTGLSAYLLARTLSDEGWRREGDISRGVAA